MPDNRALLTAAERTAKVADSLGAAFAKELSRVQRDLERELAKLLPRLDERSRTAIALAARGLKLRTQLRDLLTQAGYDDLADTATVGALERIAAAIEDSRIAAQVSAFVSSDITKIEALKELARQDVLAQGDEVAIATWRSVVQGLYSQRPVPDILDDLADALDEEMSTVRTLYDTTTSIFGRQVEALKAGDDPTTRFAYVGPVDSRMRAFCRAHVGKIYTRAEIDKMDNGQGIPVFLGAGGFNCRHVWQEVSRFSDLWDLQGTGERIPEVAQELKSVKPIIREKAA